MVRARKQPLSNHRFSAAEAEQQQAVFLSGSGQLPSCQCLQKQQGALDLAPELQKRLTVQGTSWLGGLLGERGESRRTSLSTSRAFPFPPSSRPGQRVYAMRGLLPAEKSPILSLEIYVGNTYYCSYQRSLCYQKNMLLGRGIRPYIFFFKTFESEAGLKDGALNPSTVCWKPEEQGFKSMT